MSGHAIKDIKPIPSKEIYELYTRVHKTLNEIFNFEANDCNVWPIGSFQKKTAKFYGDLDLAFNANWSLQHIATKLSENNLECRIIKGFNQVSFRFEDYQIDLMVGTNPSWIQFAYHSPDFTKQESKYKGLYRTALLQSIVSTINPKILHVTDDNQPYVIESYSMRLGQGIFSVQKSYMGKKGNVIKTPEIVGETFLTNNPQELCEIFLGTKNIEVCNSFETLWEHIHKDEYFYSHFLDKIVIKFRDHLRKGGYSYPVECYDDYPDIFGASVKRIALLPGGFKPWTPAHYSLVKSALLFASEVYVFIGPSERSGITQEVSLEIGNYLFKDYPEIKLVASDVSPIRKIYSWLEEDEREPGEYMLFASTKGNDFVRAEEFYKSYKPGGKFRHNLPPHVTVANPEIYKDLKVVDSFLGEPVSAVGVRKTAILNDKKTFLELYKTMPHKTREFIWDIITKHIKND